MTPQRLDEILERAKDLKIAVVGDIMLDKYLDIDRRLTETSLETGREAHQVTSIRCYPGGGGSVAQKLAALGVGWVPAVTVLGIDGEGYDLKAALRRDGIDTQLIIESPDRRTATYTKPMVNEPGKPPYELDRLDIRNHRPLDREIENQLMAILNRHIDQLHGVVVVDQVPERNCGVSTNRVRQFIENMAAVHEAKVFFADSRNRIGEFRHVITKPNRAELADAAGLRSAAVASVEEIRLAAEKLVSRTGRPALVTMGPEGLLVVRPDGAELVPGYATSGPIDICGAGDSVTAGAVTALCAGATLEEAALLGNLVASITIQQIGVTGTATPQQVRQRLVEYNEQRNGEGEGRGTRGEGREKDG